MRFEASAADGATASATWCEGGRDLQLRHLRGGLELKAIADDLFTSSAIPGSPRLQRNAEKAGNGLVVNTGWVRELKFQRVTISPLP